MKMGNMPFIMLSSFGLTSFVQNTKVGLRHAFAVSKSNKYYDPFIDYYGSKSSVLLRMEI